ncbi:MAG: tRNA guanosine(34) transglycosylase Tgt [Rhodospirillaceae bacterium]|nr:MAG: tRNA guanosine(34) transglycosylase Tgt [Rhodospirillaceae bacterium]
MTESCFTLLAKDGKARRGRVGTAHGDVNTPAFMPVGTAGTVKAMLPESVAATGAEILLGNTYHLMLRPGADRVDALGGLHKFMNWPKPILTDSGGFQVMSLSELRKITEQGVEFRSHLDGRKHMLSPESSTQIQDQLDSNITMCFDECTPFPATPDQAAQSMRLSMRWAARSRDAFRRRPGYLQFGIMQGGIYEHLRQESAQSLIDIGFEGYAIGGLAIGEGQSEMFRILDFAPDFLPEDRPRYLMGVGRPADIVGAVSRGIDMFDCVMPTRAGRTGAAFTRFGEINIRNARHATDPRPIDPDCACPACTSYSRGYIHHLNKAKEIVGAMLLTWHNLHYYQELMQGLRRAIETGTFADFVMDFEAGQARGDLPPL